MEDSATLRSLRHSASSIRSVFSLAIVVVLALAGTIKSFAQTDVSIPEEIEWTWEVRPANQNPKLPNILLLGDSITRNYFPQVAKSLDGIANLYLMASSTSVGDPRLPHQISEFAKLEGVQFRVVHFNNGMHGWGYTEEQFNRSFPNLISTVRKLVGKDGALVWANITPVREGTAGGATNSRIDARNAIALKMVEAAHISLDDQHALMMKHADLYEDSVHFKPEGANIMGIQAAETIRSALRRRH